MRETWILVVNTMIHWIKHWPIQTKRFTYLNTDSVNVRVNLGSDWKDSLILTLIHEMNEGQILFMNVRIHWIKHWPIQTKRFSDSYHDSLNKRDANLGHDHKDSLNQILTHSEQKIHWFKHGLAKWVKSESQSWPQRFTNSLHNTDLLNDRGENLGYDCKFTLNQTFTHPDQKIHWFKHWLSK